MSKRDYVSEILEKKKRLIDEWHNGSYKLSELEENFENLQNKQEVNNYHLSLYLVGIVTCLEIASRQAIQRLVDNGSPYLERIERFKDYLKIDLTVTKALHDKKLSFGELVSHLVPINNLENIASHLGILLDGNFSHLVTNLRYFVEPDTSLYLDVDDPDSALIPLIEVESEEPDLIVEDIKLFMSSISNLFELRHIIVHEGRFDLVDSEEKLSDFFNYAQKFINVLKELVEQTLNPNVSRTPTMLEYLETVRVGKLKEEMESLYGELYKLASDKKTVFGCSEKDELEISQTAFEEFVRTDVSLEEILVKPASGNTLHSINAYISKELYIQRIKRFKEIKDFYSSGFYRD